MTVRYDKNHKKAAPEQPFRALLFVTGGVKMESMCGLEQWFLLNTLFHLNRGLPLCFCPLCFLLGEGMQLTMEQNDGPVINRDGLYYIY